MAKRGTREDDSIVPSELSIYVRNRRKELGFHTQKQLADAIKYSQAAISDLEAGKYRPGTDILRAIADVFGMEVGALIDMLGDAPPSAKDADSDVRRAIRSHPYMHPKYKAAIEAIIKLDISERTDAQNLRIAEPRSIYTTNKLPEGVVAAAGDIGDLALEQNQQLLEKLRRETDEDG